MSFFRIAIGVLVLLLVATPPLVCILMAPVVGSLPPPGDTNVDPVRLREHVEFLSGGEVARSHDHPERLDAVATYIEAEFRKAGLRPIRQSFEVNGRTYSNVIGRYGSESAARLVVGAHYDVYGHQPGADDNASGVAGLLGLAHLLQEQKPQPGSAIELVAYTLEEPPFFMSERMGSAVHARSLKESDADIIGMISLEMIGYFSDAHRSQRYPAPLLKLLYPSRGDFVAIVARLGQNAWVRSIKKGMIAGGGVPVWSMSAPAWFPGIDFSDHASYWDEGYPAAMITDTAFLRNPNYHEATDTPATLDYERMAEVIKQVYWAVIHLPAPRAGSEVEDPTNVGEPPSPRGR
jgi:hypothetical protein